MPLNIFQFFAKVKPIIETIGILAIPFVLLIYENQRENRQIEFQRNVIGSQAEVRQQQAVRDYLSQITTIYLDVEDRNEIEQDEELRQLLEATTLAIFDELSVSEDFQDESKDENKFNREAIRKDRKGDVIDFLSKLGWINSTKEKEKPLISLSRSNLSQSDLSFARLSDANLSDANLSGAKLYGANLESANLESANLSYANLESAKLSDANLNYVELNDAELRRANLSDAKLRVANLIKANLKKTDLRRANLSDANLSGAKLNGANLSDANLNEVNLDKAILCNTTMPDGTINNRDCETK